MRYVARLFACVAFLSLAACGFHPLYAPAVQADGSSLLDQVWIDTIPGSNGIILRNYLLDGFYSNGYPDHAPYLLHIDIAEYVRDVDIQKNDTTTRAQFVILATYYIRDRATSQIIDSGQMRAISGYNILLSQYTTLVSQNDARDRALRDLADKIQTRTTLVMTEPHTAQAPVITPPVVTMPAPVTQ